MAVWQIPIKLISARECAIDWKNLIETEALPATLPEEKSWCGHIKQYGALDSTCVEIFCAEDTVEEISARIDLRNATKEQLESICAFAAANGLCIVHKNKRYVPRLESFRIIIEESDAYRFLADPRTFLDALNKE